MGLIENLQTEAERRALNLQQSRVIPVRKKIRFEVHITEHCNLNCKYCFHFSPLAKEEYLSLEEFERDMARLSTLFDGVMQEILLLGGEPLLHPEVTQFIKLTRQYFPVGDLKILTNGILLPQMSDEFWQVCHDTKTVVNYTRYPIKLDIAKIDEMSSKYGVEMAVFNMEDDIKQLVHEPLDLEGKQNAVKNFYDCYRSNLCITLKHGRMYTCLKAAHVHLFNEYFDKDIKLDEQNSIDIYKAQSGQEILEYLTKPIPMCAYCDRANITTGLEWCISKREIEEFT